MDQDTCFHPTVKGEIGAFAWHLVDELPATSEAAKQIFLNADGGRHRFHMVSDLVLAASTSKQFHRDIHFAIDTAMGRSIPS